MNGVLRKEILFINQPNYFRKHEYEIPQANLNRNLKHAHYIHHVNQLILLLNSNVNSGGDHGGLYRH
jgi:hypothetical protein